jgi:DNA-binding NarL/FixJ family response regulator
MGLVRVLLAADSSELCQELADFLTREGFAFLGTAGDVDSLVEADELLDPDVIVVDISMTGFTGTAAAQRLKRAGSRAKVVFLAESLDERLISMGEAVGGQAFVAKSRLHLDLAAAIRVALEGGKFVSQVGV